ncbi:MAG: anaerobic ribonucleoside-triphosphate reductase activating protein [Clostridia bacterium]|nr:anaerobic ribonucleoside-triphosphate reductase activating protein [Clostridia bacterium]
MKIGGYEKLSTVDYPGEMACAIFLVGCNFNCGYCHNPSLISGDGNYVPKEEVMDYLVKRRDMLDAVCISGGEPTCNPDLKEFIKEIKALGYKIKLDTNGTHPEVVEDLLKDNLLDYIAMDIKASPKKYSKVVGKEVNMNNIYKSIEILKNSGIKYEFRTTYLPELTKDDINEIATTMVKKNSKYYLQQFRNKVTNDAAYHAYVPHLPSYVKSTAEMVKSSIGMCGVRGIN